MFAAMHPSGPAAQSLRTLSGFSLPHLSVVGPVHGGFFHGSESISSSHHITSQARAQHLTKRSCSAFSAHSSSVIQPSLGLIRQ